MKDSQSPSEQAMAIWQAGVDAVASERLVRNVVSIDDHWLSVADESFDLRTVRRIVVVGAGKAGAGMATAIEEVLSEQALHTAGANCELTGWVNVPADCVRPLSRIHLHPARPAGVNEPTEEGASGSQRILELVGALTDCDLCLVLLSGGGSALLPAPVPGVSLEDKQTITRLLMHGGATINELNCVRKQLSRIKGGGLARALRCGRMISLIISDVIGDPLDVIASGPTVDDRSTPSQALEVIERIVGDDEAVPLSIRNFLRQRHDGRLSRDELDTRRVRNFIIGNNEVAVQAAAAKAAELGCSVRSQGSGLEGVAAETGRDLARTCLRVRQEEGNSTGPVCLISGGEPVVHLVDTDQPRKGGRNQELVLAAADTLWNEDLSGMAVLSGGTDGEDGPTDAAGAILDETVLREAHRLHLKPRRFLAINNAYEFFDKAGGLVRTGPTHTNVMDLRVAVVCR